MSELTVDGMFAAESGRQQFDIIRQVNDFWADRLISKSTQAQIQQWTSRDLDRFKDRESITNHIARGRQMYMLACEDDLAGIIWYGHKEFPVENYYFRQPNHTFAIRIYEGYDGQGLATPFMNATLKDYVWSLIQSPNETQFNGLWLSVDAANHRAINLYLRYGYEEVKKDDDRIFMVLSDSKIREVLGS